MLSRVADTLYWLSRNLERAEHTARQVELNLSLALEQSPEASAARWRRALRSLRIPAPEAVLKPHESALWLTFDAENPYSVIACVNAARENARQVRELISDDMWRQINRLYLNTRDARDQIQEGVFPREFLDEFIAWCYLVQGVTESTLDRGESWHFLRIGRHLERAANTSALLSTHYAALMAGAGHDAEVQFDELALLNACAALDAYRRVHTAEFQPERIVEFLLLNPNFPRSIFFAADQLNSSLMQVGQHNNSARVRKVRLLAARFRSTLCTSLTQDLIVDGLHSHLRYVLTQCSAIDTAFHHAYIAYPVEEELPG